MTPSSNIKHLGAILGIILICKAVTFKQSLEIMKSLYTLTKLNVDYVELQYTLTCTLWTKIYIIPSYCIDYKNNN